jgi:hypothetical protein
VGGQAYGSYSYTGGEHEYEVGGAAALSISPPKACYGDFIKNPVQFLGNCLNIGISAGGYYTSETGKWNILLGLQLGFGGLPALQPFTMNQALLGGY